MENVEHDDHDGGAVATMATFADADATSPLVSSNKRKERAKYTKTFPKIAANDESVRYFSKRLDTNLFDTANQVEQVLAEIAQKELNTNDANNNDGTSSQLTFLGASLTLGRWSETRQVDGLRFLLRLCPFYNTCGCTWRVKVCHNTKTGQYFIVLPIVKHQTHLHKFNIKSSSNKKKKLKKEMSPRTLQQQRRIEASSCHAENTTDTAQPLPENLPLSQVLLHDVITTNTELGPQQHQLVEDRGSARFETTVPVDEEEEEEEDESPDATNLNTGTSQREELATANTDDDDDDDDNSSPQTKTAPAQAAAAAAPAASDSSQLAQLASMTLLGVDTGDLQLIQDYSKECSSPGRVAAVNITNITTDPLYAAQQASTTTLASETPPNAKNNINNSSSTLTIYTQMLASTVSYAQNEKRLSKSETIAMAMDRLAVHLGKAMSQILDSTDTGGDAAACADYMISTRVDPRLAFDTAAMIHRGQCISQLYESVGIGKEHVLIQLAATWEGIMAAHELETMHGIHCQLTLIFSTVQAYACAQYNVHAISPHPSDITAYYKRHVVAAAAAAAPYHGNNGSVGDTTGKPAATSKAAKTNTTEDAPISISEGVMVCREIYHHFCRHGHDTICMPVIGAMNAEDKDKNISDNDDADGGDDSLLNEIRALAGMDRMIIPIRLMRKLATCHEPLKQQLYPSENRSTDNNNNNNNNKPPVTPTMTTTTTTTPKAATARTPPAVIAKNKQLLAAAKTRRRMTQQEFRYRLNMDACGTELLAKGIRAWIKDVERLEKIITGRVHQQATKKNRVESKN